MNDGTIGDASSGATTRANADTQALFGVMWNLAAAGVTGMSVSGGVGASAAADFAAHKTVTLPKILGRTMVASGFGSGLTNRTLGAIFGEENHVLSAGECPTIVSQSSNAISVNPPSGQSYPAVPSGFTIGSIQVGSIGTGSNWVPVTGSNVWGTQNLASGTNTITVSSVNTGGASHNNMQPSTFVNFHIKL